VPDDPFFDEDGDIPDDDEELVETPTDVVEALGFDPKDTQPFSSSVRTC
jgi:hypothetical protein